MNVRAARDLAKFRHVFGCIGGDDICEIGEFADDAPVDPIDPKISGGKRAIIARQLVKKYHQTATEFCFPRAQDWRQPGRAAVGMVSTASVMQKDVSITEALEAPGQLMRTLIECADRGMAELGNRFRRSIHYEELRWTAAAGPMLV